MIVRRRRRRSTEDGAVVVLMAVFSTVMVGMAALVIDVGAIHDEKRQLQNGADAAALGVARLAMASCATGTPACTPATMLDRARELADGNARDTLANIDSVTPDYSAKTVTVHTSTLEGGGSAILPYQFARALTGSEGKTVRASATASWAGVRTAPVVRLTLSRCEFLDATTAGTVYDVPTEILFHGQSPGCPGGPNGADVPGGFGWLKDTDANPDDCIVTVSAEATVGADPGNSAPSACQFSNYLGDEILIAIFDAVAGTGNNATYHVFGFAQFHVTGFRFPSGGNGGVRCATNACLAGSFVRFVPTGDLGGPNLGDRVALVS